MQFPAPPHFGKEKVAMTYGVTHIHLCLLLIIAVALKVAPF
jgi:hypothetical protein